MEPVQIVLLIVIVVLTFLLTVLGIQVFLILRELRKTVEKTNKVLDDAGIISESIATPVSTLSSVVMSIKTGISFANWLKKTYDLLLHHTSHKDTKEQSKELSQEDSPPQPSWGIGEQTNGETEPSPTPSKERKSREAASDAANAGSDSDRPMVRRFFRGIGRKIKF